MNNHKCAMYFGTSWSGRISSGCCLLALAAGQALAQPSLPIFSGREIVGSKTVKSGVSMDAISPQSAILADIVSDAPPIDPERSLLIRDVLVVEDETRTFDPFTKKGLPNGPWTFGTLVKELAKQNGANVDPVVFLQKMINSWTEDRTVNGDELKKRENVSTISAAWRRFSGPKLDINQAPFRLLAIVNRVDLRNGRAENAGEARFVFGAIDTNGNPIPFTLIFEYGVSVADFAELQAWAKRWADLSTGDKATYNARLQLITNDYTTSLGPRKARPVGAILNQIRTNEIALKKPWQLREFNIDPSGLPVAVTTKKTAQDIFATDAQAQAILAKYLQQHAPVITQQGTHEVPEAFESRKLLAGKSEAPTETFLWGPIAGINEITRRAFSLNTCNGCHSGETGTRFTHVDPRPAGKPSELSGFLKGITLRPVQGQPEASYADLERRRQDLLMLISPFGSATESSRAPLQATH